MVDLSAHWGGKPSVLVSRLRNVEPLVKQVAARPRQRSMCRGSGAQRGPVELPIEPFPAALRRAAPAAARSNGESAAMRSAPSASAARARCARSAVRDPHRGAGARAAAALHRWRSRPAVGPASSGSQRSRLGSISAIKLDQAAPALIVEREHPLDRSAEGIRLLVRQGAPRRLLVAAAGHSRADSAARPRPP